MAIRSTPLWYFCWPNEIGRKLSARGIWQKMYCPQKMYKMSMRKPRLVSSFILIIAEVSTSNVPFSIVGFLSLQTSGHDLNNGLKYLQIKLILDEVT